MSYAMRFECDAPDCGRHFWTGPDEVRASDETGVLLGGKPARTARGVHVVGTVSLAHGWTVVMARTPSMAPIRQLALCSDHRDWRP